MAKPAQLWVGALLIFSLVYSTRDLILREEHVQLLKKLIPVMISKENEIEFSQNHIFRHDLQQDIQMYPEKLDMEDMVVNGTFYWTKSAKSVLFLKKHKCASSTFTTVIQNYMLWRGLKYEPQIFKSLGGCYPARWNPYCRPPTALKNFLPSIKYHHRLNLEEQLPLMEPGTKVITTIRQPLSFLHSAYNYFYGKYEDVQSGRKMGCDVSCNGVPYFEINQNQSQVPVNIFLDNLERNFNPNAPYSHRVQNFQSFEMGMDEKITDETQMRVELQRLIDRFDVIVLIERFWESLVLIALSLHIPVEYLYAPSENISVKYEKPDLSPSQLAVYQKYFKMDIIMYEMAETKLERQIDAFGRENMKKQVDKLIEYAKLCEQDSSVCSRKSHVTYKKSPHIKKLQLELTKTGERIGEKLDRDKVAKIMKENGGYCERGIYTSITEKRSPWHTCVAQKNHPDFVSWWKP